MCSKLPAPQMAQLLMHVLVVLVKACLRTSAARMGSHLQGRLIALFTSDAQVIAQATAVLPLIAFVMVSTTCLPIMPLAWHSSMQSVLPAE